MPKVVLLHSALGLTNGMHSLAELLCFRGCAVEMPDYYAGRTFPTTAAGVAHRDQVGYRTLLARVSELDVDRAALVGFSLGASFAQRLARPGVRLVALVGSVDPLPPGKAWCGVDAQLHQYAEDSWVEEDDVLGFAAAVTKSGARFDRFVAPGSGHLFTEPSQAEYDRGLTGLTVDRILAGMH